MSNQLLYQCVVIDNQDPLMLGRVRATLVGENYADVVKSIRNPPFNEEKDAWTARDPFIFNPLLPFFIYQVPKVEELINILYYNNEFKYRNQFYIQAMFSSPNRAPFEYYVGSQKFTGIGVQYTDPIPVKNQDGTYPNSTSKGVFPEPGDNAILGRGNADVIVKENGILIRANKIKGDFQPNTPPIVNNKGAFLQLTKFDGSRVLKAQKIFSEIFESVVLSNYLIEYVIINPENAEDRFSGYVYLYKLKADTRVNSKNLKVDSSIDDLKSLILIEEFTALPMKDTINFINGTINKINTKNVINGIQIFTSAQKFPIFYRPSPSFYEVITLTSNSGTLSQKNASAIYGEIKLNNTATNAGYGLIYTENKVGVPTSIKKTKGNVYEYNSNPVTYASLGGDKLFLLSQQSNKFGLEPINFSDTAYGISDAKYVTEILPKTSSLVRGEELMELINLIVRYLITHTHSFPGLPPLPVGYDGSTSTQILTELQNAANKILNENIRLN